MYGAAEYLDDNGTPAAWVALEDLGVLDRRWPTSRFRLLARHAGQFNGWSLTTDRGVDWSQRRSSPTHADEPTS